MQRDRSLRKLLKSAASAGVAFAIFAVPAAARGPGDGNGNVNGNRGCGQVVSEVAREAPRGPGGVHGRLVSTAAHTCQAQRELPPELPE